jgi:HK97 family phage major capsid protein
MDNIGSTLSKMYEARKSILEKMKDVTQRGKDGKLDKEKVSVEFDKLEAEIKQLDREILILEAEETILSKGAASVNGKTIYAKEQALEQFADYCRTGQLPEMRTGTFSTTSSAGGYTIPTILYPMIEAAEAEIGGMLTPGLARWLYLDHGRPITIPTIDDTSVYSYKVSEAGDLTSAATGMTFGATTLNSYKYTSGMVYVSRELLEDSGYDFGSWLIEQLLLRDARGLNKALTTGSGTSDVNGVKWASTEGEAGGVRTVTTTDLANLMYSVNESYRRLGTWMFNSTVEKSIRALAAGTADSRLLWSDSVDSGIAKGTPKTLYGYPVIINEEMDGLQPLRRPIIFGNFQKYIIRSSRPIIRRLDELRGATDEVCFVVLRRVDADLPTSGALKCIECANT